MSEQNGVLSERMSKIKREAVGQIEHLIVKHGDKIEKAFLQTEGALSLSINVNLAGTEPVNLKTTLTFTESQVKDHEKGEVYLGQQDMFEEGGEPGEDPGMGEPGEER